MSPADTVRRYGILDRFCGDKMRWEHFRDMPWDAYIYTNEGAFVGIAKIFSQAGNFGNKAIVEIPAEPTSFMYELGLLTHKKPAIIVKFRNKVAYLRLDHLNYRRTEGTKKPTYVIPIGEFRVV